jgi:tetratricopeptide (TPR) repeat protein
MAKSIVLELTGNLQQGVRVVLVNPKEGDRPIQKFKGELPPAPKLLKECQRWKWSDRILVDSSAIKTVGNDSVSLTAIAQKPMNISSSPLDKWLNSESFHPLRIELQKQLKQSNEVEMIFRTDNIELRQLPWHKWTFFKRYSKLEIVFSCLAGEPPTRPQIITRGVPLRVLLIAGNNGNIDLPEDLDWLERLLKAEISFLIKPKLQDLSHQLLEDRWDIVFFTGLSETHSTNETGQIKLNSTESLTVKDLKIVLRNAVANGLQLAVFNCCNGLELAQELESIHIPQILVMRQLLPDIIAQKILIVFLEKLISGNNFYQALRSVREKLKSLENQFQNAPNLPVLCLKPGNKKLKRLVNLSTLLRLALLVSGVFVPTIFVRSQLPPPNPKIAPGHYQKCEQQYRVEKYTSAIKECEEALRNNPNYPEALIQKGLVLKELQQPKEASKSFDQALQVKPVSAHDWYYRGLALHQLKRYPEAIDAYDKAIGLSPKNTNPDAWYERGNAEFELGQFELGQFELRRYKEAVNDYAQAIKIKPNHLLALFRQGTVYKKLRKWEEANATYNKSLQMGAGDSHTWQKIASYFYEENDPRKALDASKKISQEEETSDTCYLRGLILKELNDHKDALAAFEKAISLSPNQDLAKAEYQKALTLEALHEEDKAIIAYGKLLEKYPNFPDAQDALLKQLNLLGKKGRCKEAEGYFKKVTNRESDKVKGVQEKLRAYCSPKFGEQDDILIEFLKGFQKIFSPRKTPDASCEKITNVSGIAYAKKLYDCQKYPEAETEFRRLASEQNPEAIEGLANTLYKQCQYEEAMTEFDFFKSLSMDFTWPESEANYHQARRGLEQHTKESSVCNL